MPTGRRSPLTRSSSLSLRSQRQTDVNLRGADRSNALRACVLVVIATTKSSLPLSPLLQPLTLHLPRMVRLVSAWHRGHPSRGSRVGRFAGQISLVRSTGNGTSAVAETIGLFLGRSLNLQHRILLSWRITADAESEPDSLAQLTRHTSS